MILYQNTAFKQVKINLCNLFTYFFSEQMWRKIRENLRTASLKLKFNRSYKNGQHQAIVWKTSKLVLYQYNLVSTYRIFHRFTLREVSLFLKAKSPATQTRAIARTRIKLELQELWTTLSFCILPTYIF